jgi:hypothetical protein
MARAKTKDAERDSIAESGHCALLEWGKHERMRFNAYPSANILWLASHGGGRTNRREPDLPEHLKPVERAVLKLNPLARTLIDCFYLRGNHPKTIAVKMNISVRTFYDRLKNAQCYVAGAIA